MAIERYVRWKIPACIIAKCSYCLHRWEIGLAEYPTECPKCGRGGGAAMNVTTLVIPGRIYQECIEGWEIVTEAGWPTPSERQRGKGRQYVYENLDTEVAAHIVDHIGDLCTTWLSGGDSNDPSRSTYHAGARWARAHGYRG